jgi:hypothetical protein
MRIDCSTVAIVSIVSVVVIDCTRIGLSPPSGTLPIFTSLVLYLEYPVKLLQYFFEVV